MAVDPSFKNMVDTLNDLDAGVQSERTENIPVADTTESTAHIKKLLESFDDVDDRVDEKSDQLKGRDKFRAKRKKRPGGESPHPARGKLVGESEGNVDEVLQSLNDDLMRARHSLVSAKDESQELSNIYYRLEDLIEDIQSIRDTAYDAERRPDESVEEDQESVESIYKDVREAFEAAEGRKVVPANKTLWNIAKEEHKEVFESAGKRSGNQYAMKWYQQNGGTWKLK